MRRASDVGVRAWPLLAACVLACGSDPAEPAAADAGTGSSSTGTETTTEVESTGSQPTTGSSGDSSSSEGESSTGAGPVYADVYPLDASHPEGGTFDLTDEVFYVGTLEGGSVHRIDPLSGDNETFYAPTDPGTWITLGMAIDETRRRLWVCAADTDTDRFTGELWMFDLSRGTREQAIPLHAGEDVAWCEDVAVASDGTAYATDRENPNIYRVDAGFEAELLVTDKALGSPLLGQNGVIVLPGDEALIAAIHAPPQLNHVDIATGTVTPVVISGEFTDTGLGTGADGMVYIDGMLFVVFDGKLARVTPTSEDWSSADSTMVEWPRGLTDVLSTPQGLYLLNGQAIQFALGQDPLGPFELSKFTGEFTP
ncbi:MAG: hypothetical protein ACRBN8_18825 [Nannocystales bacterium]